MILTTKPSAWHNFNILLTTFVSLTKHILVKSSIDEVYKLLGKKYFYRTKSEDSNKVFRRSIFVVKNILKGEKFTKYNIRRIRPGYGVSPVYYEKILNKKSPSNLIRGNPLNLNILKKLKII